MWQQDGNYCDDEDEDLIGRFGGVEIAVGKTSGGATNDQLYLLPCGTPGAYNINQIGIIYSPQEQYAQVADFPNMSDTGPSTQQQLVNAHWDELTRSVSEFSKGRGIGDCGSSAIWKWNGDPFQKSFVLVEQRFKDACDGKMDKWPLVWPN